MTASTCNRILFLLLATKILINAGGEKNSKTYSHRKLYDHSLDDTDIFALKVQTYSTLVDPVGITTGEYDNTKGLFVSSYQSNTISFISLEHNGYTKLMESNVISGGIYNMDTDGEIDTATYSEPTRLAYDHQCGLLFVACKGNKVIRVINFKDNLVSTLQTDQGDTITFSGSDQYQLSLPGFDIHSVDGDSLYVTDTTILQRVVTSSEEPYCESITSSAALISYHSLSYYMQLHEYPSNSRINSVLLDERRNVIYVAISEGKNVILKVPTSAIYSNQYGDISCLVGNEGLSWSGMTNTQFPPIATNGYASGGSVTLAFPMHLEMSGDSNTLFWTECFPYAGEFLLGSLAVRRIDLDDGWVDFYAGQDFTEDKETYRYVGTEGGYINAEVSSASFRYPVTMTYYEDDKHAGGGESGSLYVVDRDNNAIRRIAVVVDTAAPTGLYFNADPSSAPSKFPTQRPTVSAEPTVTYYPSKAPSTHPTLSIAPTSNPSKRPTRRPTMKPTTLAPTTASVWIQDNSLFSSMGFGTVHVGVGMYMTSVLVGVVLSALIVLAYTQRHVSPHQQLRTAEQLHEYEGSLEYLERKCRFAGTHVLFWMGACIPGSAFYSTSRSRDSDDTFEHGHDEPGEGASFVAGLTTAFRNGFFKFFSRTGSPSNNHTDGDEAANDSDHIRNVLQSVRDSSSEQQRRNASQPSNSSYTHTSMSPQEYRELTPREQEEGNYDIRGSTRGDLELDDSSRSTTPMIVRTFGSTYDGL